MLTGKIISYSPKTQCGMLRCNLLGQVYSFKYGHALDRTGFKPGTAIVFNTSHATDYAINVQLATAAFRRYADQYDPDAHCLTIREYVKRVAPTDKYVAVINDGNILLVEE